MKEVEDPQDRKLLQDYREHTLDLLSFFGPNKGLLTISDLKVEDKNGLDVAVNCMSEMMRSGVYKGESIGLVTDNLPKFVPLGQFQRGRVILYQMQDDGAVTTYSPASAQSIEDRKKDGSSNFILEKTKNVPASYVLQVLTS